MAQSSNTILNCGAGYVLNNGYKLALFLGTLLTGHVINLTPNDLSFT